MPEEGFRDLELRVAYGPGDDPLHRFYLPVLSRTVHYDRSAGYFSSGALVVAAQGLARLIANGGRMRLLVGAELSEGDVAAIRTGAALTEVTRDRLVALLEEPEDRLARRRLEALAWMVAAGTLAIKVVLPRGRDGLPLPAQAAEGYYHPKKGLFTDAAGDRVGFSGSINESIHAWRHHFEEFHVYRSWASGEHLHLSQVETYFNRVWEGRDPDWIALEVHEALRAALLRYRPDEPPTTDPLEAEAPASPAPLAPSVGADDAVVAQFLRDLPHLVGIGPTVGRTTAAIRPWPHQVRVAERVVGRFPERFLLADEVGLGKTIEAGLVLRDLAVSGVVRRCLILAPASVVRQWQDELHEKFGLEAAHYDGQRLLGAGPDREVLAEPGTEPWHEVGFVLASSQLVKRRGRREVLLDAPEWDLVVVDEAHHARRRDFQDLTNRRPNRLLELLEGCDGRPGLAERTHGLLLLTATPMQVHPVEVWDLLSLLGLTGRWGASEFGFLAYFSQLRIASRDRNAADWVTLARMADEELRAGGGLDPAVETQLAADLGAAGWHRVREFPHAADPVRWVRDMTDDQVRVLVRMLRHLTPLRRRMFRHTRGLLRAYQRQGLLPGRVAERDPQLRWIDFTAEEAELYRRVEEYISDFYQRYERTRRGLGFVMTVYRRRLTSSFAALRCSLERRLAYLEGQVADPGLTDEDLEEAALTEDADEQVWAGPMTGWPDSVPEAALADLHAREAGYVRDFLDALAALGTDTKFDQLMRDLDTALRRYDSVVLFSQYADTVDDLKERLREVYGHRIACYTGRAVERWDGSTWAPVTKEEVKRAFRDGDVQLLLGTDALAEGLNLQTCGVEINYDAPWNPMRLEQRIGRIDRIGQRYEQVRILTYFHEGTIEAKVYRRLSERIDWFQGVVGPLQPILHHVERSIRELALVHPAERETRLAQELERLTGDVERLTQTPALDLDPDPAEVPAPPPVPEPPVTPAELEAFCTTAGGLAHRFRAHPTIPGAYVLTHRGQDLAVTFDPGVSDEHSDTLRLLTVGDRVLSELLSAVGDTRSGPGRVARFRTVGSAYPHVAWYRPDGDIATPIERLADLRGALDREPLATATWVRQAREDMATRLHERLRAERDRTRARHEERCSTLAARARLLLAEAALVRSRRRAASELAPEPTAEHPVAVDALVRHERYPYGPLRELAGIPDPVEWDLVQQQVRVDELSAGKLDARWRSLRQRADDLVHRLAEAKRLLDLIPTEVTTPEVTVELY